MRPWEELRKKFSNYEHPLWQYSLGLECSLCKITPSETYEDSLVIVDGQGDTLYCKNCYMGKFVVEEFAGEEDWEYSFDEEDYLSWLGTEEWDISNLPTEQLTLDNWS